MNWYYANSEQKHVRQVVLQATAENEVGRKFGTLLLSAKFLSLQTSVWATGFFYLDSDPGPFLMVRGDKVASKLTGSPVTAAICFYRMKAGGLVTIYVHVDCPAVAKMLTDPIVLFENSYGLDYENRGMKEIIERAISNEALHLCFTEGDGPAKVFPDGRGFESKGIESKFDVVIPLSHECRAILKKEYESLLSYHQNIPSSVKNYNQSVQQMWAENPQGSNPILPRPVSAPSKTVGSSGVGTTTADPPRCPIGHGELRPWEGKLRCWKCGWEPGQPLPQKPLPQQPLPQQPLPQRTLGCKLGFHNWSGCRCVKCGKTRNEGHDWSKDCEVCTRCGFCRSNAHKWNGCKCSVCAKIRDDGHVWEGCTCSICGKTRDEGHDWSKDCEICARCGRTRPNAHNWQGHRCSVCGVAEPITPTGKFQRRVITALSEYPRYTLAHIRQCLLLPEVVRSYGYNVMVGGTREELAGFVIGVLSRESAAYNRKLDMDAIRVNRRSRMVSSEPSPIEVNAMAVECDLAIQETSYGYNKKVCTRWIFNVDSNLAGDPDCMVACQRTDIPRNLVAPGEKGVPLVGVRDIVWPNQ